MAEDSVPEPSGGCACPPPHAFGLWAEDGLAAAFAVFGVQLERLAEELRARAAASKEAAEDPTNRVALDTTLTPERLAVLASDADRWVRVGVASNPRSSPETLRLLARDEESLVRMYVGSRLCGEGWDPWLPVIGDMNLLDTFLLWRQPDPDQASRAERGLADIVVTLASDPKPVVRRSVWNHPDLPERFLRVAAGDSDDDERAAAAASRFIPSDLLRQLAADPCWRVRTAVGANESSPTPMLTQLASDRDSEVRRAVARNISSSLETLQDLARDPGIGVRTSALANLRHRQFDPQAKRESSFEVLLLNALGHVQPS